MDGASMKYHEYEKTVTVACVNWSSIWGDKKANLDKMKTKAIEAAKAGANIVAFPELALSGYECGEEARKNNTPCSMHTEAAETIPGQSTREIAKLAKDLGIYVILGMPEQDKRIPKIHYNSSAVIGPEGILGRCRKINLSVPPIWTETICFKPGNDLPIFETKFGPIGVLICKDFWHAPELSRILYLKGARIIFNLAGSPAGPGKNEFMTYITACRAVESMIYTASSNHVGEERTSSYYGCSTIAGPSYPRMIKIFSQGGDTEEIVCATLNFESLNHWKSFADLKREINWKLIAKEYKALADIG
jgi:predicted amidohydrolase